MPKGRASEVVFILDKLRELDCYPQNVTRSSNVFTKGHLVELMPIFSDLIVRND